MLHGIPSPAVRILIVAGVLNLALSFALGWILSAVRMKNAMEKHQWLLTAHVVSLQEGVLLLGVAFVFSVLGAEGQLATWAAWLLAGASFFQDFSGIANWIRRTKDQFAEKSFGWVLATINAVMNTAGLGIVVYLVFTR